MNFMLYSIIMILTAIPNRIQNIKLIFTVIIQTPTCHKHFLIYQEIKCKFGVLLLRVSYIWGWFTRSQFHRFWVVRPQESHMIPHLHFVVQINHTDLGFFPSPDKEHNLNWPTVPPVTDFTDAVLAISPHNKGCQGSSSAHTNERLCLWAQCLCSGRKDSEYNFQTEE